MRYFNEPTEANPIYPCGTCNKKVIQRHKAIQCDLCNYWNHIKCDGIDNKFYEILKESDESVQHYCKLCKEEIFAFQTLSDDQYIASIIKGVDVSDNLNLQLFPPPPLKILFNDLDNRNKDEPAAINCSYYDFSTPIPNTNKDNNSMFHLNIAS